MALGLDEPWVIELPIRRVANEGQGVCFFKISVSVEKTQEA